MPYLKMPTNVLASSAKMLGHNKKGGIGLYVDIGTIGYFRDLKVTKRTLQVKPNVSERVNGI